MPRRKKSRVKTNGADSRPLTEVAKELGVSITSVRNWIPKEKSLKGSTRREGKAIHITAAGAVELAKVRDRRFAAANPALRKAWAARRAGAGKPKAARPTAPRVVKGPKRSGAKKGGHPGLEKAWAARRRNAAARRAAVSKTAGNRPGARSTDLDSVLGTVRAAVEKETRRASQELRLALKASLKQAHDALGRALALLE